MKQLQETLASLIRIYKDQEVVTKSPPNFSFDLDDDDDWIPPEYHDASADVGSPASSIRPDDLSATGRAMPHQVPFDDDDHDDFDDPSVWEDLNFDASF